MLEARSVASTIKEDPGPGSKLELVGGPWPALLATSRSPWPALPRRSWGLGVSWS